jgi:hypothetical protein
MARKTKLAELVVNETSGVDHPAHLHEGWLVIKSAADQQAQGENVELEIPETVNEQIEKDASDTDIRKEMTDLRKELADLRKQKEAIEAEREIEKAVEAAHAWGNLPGLNPKEFAPSLVALRKASPEIAAQVEAIFAAASTALAETDILKESGTVSEPQGSGDAWTQIEALANDLIATGKVDSFAKAVTTVATSNMDLYTRYLQEKGI